jgi:hypothetical protein
MSARSPPDGLLFSFPARFKIIAVLNELTFSGQLKQSDDPVRNKKNGQKNNPSVKDGLESSKTFPYVR